MSGEAHSRAHLIYQVIKWNYSTGLPPQGYQWSPCFLPVVRWQYLILLKKKLPYYSSGMEERAQRKAFATFYGVQFLQVESCPSPSRSVSGRSPSIMHIKIQVRRSNQPVLFSSILPTVPLISMKATTLSFLLDLDLAILLFFYSDFQFSTPKIERNGILRVQRQSPIPVISG